MGTIKEGARQAVRNCLKIKPKEKVVIIADEATLNVALVIKEEVMKITKDIHFFIMEDFGKRPLTLPKEIELALKGTDVSFYIAQSFGGNERVTFRKPMLDIIEASGRIRHAHMIGITPEIMETGVCADYRRVQELCQRVYEKVKDAKQIRVLSKRGTDFTAEFSPKLRWVIYDGDIKPGIWANLPDGEVFTSPAEVNGIIVVDGCFGSIFDDKYGSIKNTPATIKIRNSRIQEIQCKNKKLKQELLEYTKTDENSNRVGEFAIGTNVDIKKLIGNMLQDEKFPGIHIAFGNPLPFDSGADWDSDTHLDAVIQKPTIIVDGETIMKTGKFLLQY